MTNEMTPEQIADLRRARGLVTLIDACASAAGRRDQRALRAWRLVDSAAELNATVGRMAAARATKLFGHRPCARVGLRTKPFHVVSTRKGPLARVGRIIGGHRRIGL